MAKKYKTEYNGRDNKKYTNEKEYVAVTAYERVLNPTTEAYEYKEIIINHKEDWNNTVENLKANNFEEEEKGE